MKTSKKVAIVYDWVDKWGGVERVLLALHTLFPKAPLFTSYYDKNKAIWAKHINVIPSFINQLPIVKSNRVLSFPLFPFAFESFDLSQYDIVISVTSSFAKSIITKPGTLHVCYVLTPTRYLWIYPENYIPLVFRSLFLPFWNYIREWDKLVSNRPDRLISLSKIVASRVQDIYDKKTEVLYPPFDTAYWKNIKNEVNASFNFSKYFIPKSYFLVVSRLEKYKKIDLLIKTFNIIKKDLIVVGKGSQMHRLRHLAGDTIHFLEDISDKELAFLYMNAQALIMPQEEDFGYVALEAQFMGCPVLSYRKSGVSEIIKENKTGLFFSQQSISSIREVLERFDQISYNLKGATVMQGEEVSAQFDTSFFRSRLLHILQ